LLRKRQKTLGGYFFAAPCRLQLTRYITNLLAYFLVTYLLLRRVRTKPIWENPAAERILVHYQVKNNTFHSVSAKQTVN